MARGHMPESTRQKIALARRGKKRSVETCEKIRVANKRRHRGFVKPDTPPEIRRGRSVKCQCRVHAMVLKDDPERLRTAFIENVISLKVI